MIPSDHPRYTPSHHGQGELDNGSSRPTGRPAVHAVGVPKAAHRGGFFMPITKHLTSRLAERRAQYDTPQHRKTRARLKPYADAGLLNCARCGDRIQPGQPWDLDHSDDRHTYLGASHARCNRSAGARRGNGGGE